MASNNKPNVQDSGLAETLRLHQQSDTKKQRKRLLGWCAFFLLLAAGAVIWAMRDPSGTIQYRTQPAHRGDMIIKVTATGNLQPTNQVVISSELSGTVKSVEVDYNDQIKIGQVLTRLDTSTLSAQVLQSRAALASAQAKVLQTQATITETQAAFNRLLEVGRLSRNKALAKSELDTARAALDRAKADYAGALAAVSQAEATLKLNQTDLAKTEIRSPINGIVLTRSVEPGQTVAASLQAPELFSLAENLAQMELHVDVDEADVGQVQAGQTASFTVDAYPDRSYPAELTQVRFGAKTTNGVVTYETILTVDNSDLSLRPGMTATADIIVTKKNDILLVPNAALRFTPKKLDATKSGGGSLFSKLMPRPPRRTDKRKEAGGVVEKNQQVWVLIGDRPVATPVTIGLTDGTSTQVVGGNLQAGMELIIDAGIGKQ
ncbi:efflux RND transporter periplasmic adaptor subunit [Desulfopila sp. IMCC35006]|uniref:efflux RND transporter periplasmic adaptor subunit n=1 Tax=Desulfopila sp. IMCC35006 TaxID=2569542 RepID=UPI0010AD6A68|nr:efflux RND transporter periplasmic adaptor subunit [Desulfopila sp. IMCC35006]TKB27174.1 efflux RND transporter periplasmic adaptor subunit [Desulfopila sp. IMCC35006]